MTETRALSHKVGLGLRPAHFSYLETRPQTNVAWLEAHTESFLNPQGRALSVLKTIRQDYPVALHGKSLNIGNPEGPRTDYLQGLRELINRTEPFLISDHLCWTGTSSQNFHDLLPLPFTEETVQIIVNNIDLVQSFLRRPLVLENISNYISFKHSYLTEWEFISEVSKRSGCGLLLDLNNIYINSHNHGFDPHYYLNHIPMDRVVQVHISGPTRYGDFLYESHSNDVPAPVWDLLKQLAPNVRHLPILIERDSDIPDFQTLEKEVLKATQVLEIPDESERITTAI